MMEACLSLLVLLLRMGKVLQSLGAPKCLWVIGLTSLIALHASGGPDWLDFDLRGAHNEPVVGHKAHALFPKKEGGLHVQEHSDRNRWLVPVRPCG